MRVNLCGEKWCCCSVAAPFPLASARSSSRLLRPHSPFAAGSYATASYTTSFTVCCRYLHFIFACGERKCKLIYYAQATECSRQAREEEGDSWQERRLLLPYWRTIKKPNEKNEQKDEEAAAEEYEEEGVAAAAGKSSIGGAAWQLHPATSLQCACGA